MKSGFLYILSNKKNGTLYIGVTSNLNARMAQHKAFKGSEFAAKYKLDKLVYVEIFENPHDARHREFQMKKWKRNWKIKRIEASNPNWDDLSDKLNHL